jgi:hypothetical protein
LPNWLTDLSLTVSGASSGNGTFALSDFTGMFWSTPVALDLSHELVGQPTPYGPWGTEVPFGFNGSLVFLSTSAAPSDWIFFTMRTDGGTEDLILLTSAAPAGVPEPRSYTLIGSGVLLSILFLRRGLPQ